MARWLCEAAFADALERLEWEIHRLDARDKEWSAAKQRVRVRQDKMSRADRAFSFVFVAGILEEFFRVLNLSLAEDLQRVEVRARELRPAALSMLYPKAWEALNTDRVVKLVKRREVVDRANNFYTDLEPLDLSGLEHLGLNDGRTVNIHHFEAVWEGVCLSPSSEPVWLSDGHRQAIATLADKRNTIAHFETDPRVEAFRFTYGDLLGLVTKVSQTVERIQEHTLLWLDRYEPAVTSSS